MQEAVSFSYFAVIVQQVYVSLIWDYNQIYVPWRQSH